MKKFKLSVFIFIIALAQNIYPQDVPYVPTPYDVVNEMLALAQVNENDIVYDLGCGDGRIVVTAAKEYGAKGVGIDSNPQRIKESKANAEKNNVTDKVEFKQQDLFKTDLSEATVLTLYLLNSVNLRLRPTLFKELKPGTRIVSHSFDMGDWEPDDKRSVDGRSVYFWKMPANFSGQWDINAEGNSKENYILNLNQQFQNISGSVKINNEDIQISDAKVDGNKIEFSIKEKDSSEKTLFEGELKDNKIAGRMVAGNSSNHDFTAVRKEGTMKPLDPASK